MRSYSVICVFQNQSFFNQEKTIFVRRFTLNRHSPKFNLIAINRVYDPLIIYEQPPRISKSTQTTPYLIGLVIVALARWLTMRISWLTGFLTDETAASWNLSAWSLNTVHTGSCNVLVGKTTLSGWHIAPPLHTNTLCCHSFHLGDITNALGQFVPK